MACFAEVGGYVGKGAVKRYFSSFFSPFSVCVLKRRFATLAQRLPNDPSHDDEVLFKREEAVTQASERTAQLAVKHGELLAILRAAQQPSFSLGWLLFTQNILTTHWVERLAAQHRACGKYVRGSTSTPITAAVLFVHKLYT